MTGRETEASAELLVETDTATAKLLTEALKPEVSSQPSRRTRTRIEAGPRGVTLRIEASDLNALRAALTPYVRWIETALKTISLVRRR